jgi:predicted alpha/beta-fold hydrolase
MPIYSYPQQKQHFFKNGHVHTLVPYFTRKVPGVDYRRERLDTPDGDFLDLDWSKCGSDSLLILSHGLEGSADRAYVKGMVKLFNQQQFDCLAWNFRSCSGELNRLPRFYHSGDTADLDLVVRHALAVGGYRQILLVGFSMGGNINLKWLGECGDKVPKELICAVAISAPIDLAASSVQLARPQNVLYMANFLYTMKQKLMNKRKVMKLPDISFRKALMATSFPVWDNVVTAPLHGFTSAQDYYQKSSSINFLKDIRVPFLLLNARNDPFLSPACFPVELAKSSSLFHLSISEAGGHVGFMHTDGSCGAEDVALAFYRMITAKT